MGKPTTCICENKGADQLLGNREADQRLCFRYMDSTIPLLPKYKISCFHLSSVTVQPDLFRLFVLMANILLNGEMSLFHSVQLQKRLLAAKH